MDGDTLTVGGTEYEDMLRESLDGGSEDGALGGLSPLANYTALQSMMSEVWSWPAGWQGWQGWQAAGPWLAGVQVHEAAALLLSALLVAVHGLLGLVPLLALLPRWLLGSSALLQWSLAAGCVLAGLLLLGRLCVRLNNVLCSHLFQDLDADDEKDSQEEEAPVVESIVSAQLEKEERVQRWINNLCDDRDQVNLEACGEMKGRNMDAEESSADLLGDGQPPLTLAALPALPALPCADLSALSLEGKRALSLAYELSLAVRQQADANVKVSLSAPPGLTLDHQDWKVVRRGKEALEEPAVSRKDTTPSPEDVARTPTTRTPLAGTPTRTPQHKTPLSGTPPSGTRTPQTGTPPTGTQLTRMPPTGTPLTGTPPTRTPHTGTPPTETPPSRTPNTGTPPTRTPHTGTPPTGTPPNGTLPTGTQPTGSPPTGTQPTGTPPTGTPPTGTPPTGTPSNGTPPTGTPPMGSRTEVSSSLLSCFVRRFSGSGFLLRELANAANATAEGLGFRDTNVEQRLDASQRSSLALPKIDMMSFSPADIHKVVDCDTDTESESSAPPRPLRTAEAETSVTPPAGVRDNMMKVFSKGILSEGSSTSILQDQAAGFTRAAPRVSCSSTTTSMMTDGAYSSLTRNPPPDKDPAGSDTAQAHWGCSPLTTSRGLTANMSEEGIPRRLSDLEAEHKSLFDIKKSLLTSIPEAAPPDEDH